MERCRVNFWNNVDSLRKARGLSWSKMAIRMEMNYNNLLQSREQLNLPRIDRLKKFADVLECSPEDLIRGIFN